MEENWDDYDFVMEQVKANGDALQYASEKLRQNPDIVAEAVKSYGGALIYASEELRSQSGFMLEMLKIDMGLLKYATSKLLSDFDFMLQAVKLKGEVLQYASKKLRQNPEIVKEAVSQEERALQYASKKLKSNLDFILEVINEKNTVIFGISDNIKEECIKRISDANLKSVIVSSMVSKEKLKRYIDLSQCKYKKIGMPANMTFGIEIESEGEQSDKLYNNRFILQSGRNNKWRRKYDLSLDDGIEVISPILTDNKSDVEDIYLICKKLNNLGQIVSERCGGHVHIGADYLTSKEAYKNLYEIWGNAEEIILKMCNEKGDLPREGFQSYAGTVASKINNAIEQESINVESENDLNNFVSSLKEIQGQRDVALNIQNVNTSENTIEFRVSNGTINPDTWIENIRLYGRIVEMSEKIALIEKNDNVTEEEKHIAELKERLKEDIPETEKMEVLLDMLFSEEEKDVYRQRYNESIQMIKKEPSKKELFTSENVVVDFKKKKKEKVEFKELASREKQSDIQKIEEDFIAEIEKGLEQEAEVER